MTQPLFLLVWVSLCVTLALWLWRAEWKMEPTGLSDWPCICSHFLLLPGQRGRQSWASGVFWSLGLTQGSLQHQNPKSCMIYSNITILFSDSEHIWLFHKQQHFVASSLSCRLLQPCERGPAEYLSTLRVWICQTPALSFKIWAANLQDQLQFFLAGSIQKSPPQTWW